MCRILDIDPREILTPGLCDAVDAMHEYGKKMPDTFEATPFDNAEERDDCLVLMRLYAECGGEKGYTIYTKTTNEPEILVWKVTDRRGSKKDDE